MRREAATERRHQRPCMAITAADGVARNRMDMQLMQMRLHKSRKALAAAAVVVVRVAPCKPIARNSTVNSTVPRMAASWTERAWRFCTAKYEPIIKGSATSAHVSHRSIWS